MADKILPIVGRFELAGALWVLADLLEKADDGKHEQHLLMLASGWIKNLKAARQNG